MAGCSHALDVLALGSVMVEVTPKEAGADIAGGAELTALPGGASCNFASALAKLGVSVALATGAGDDEWGAWLRARLTALGIDASRVKTVEGQLSTVSFCWVDREGGKRFYFYRVAGHSDPIAELTVEDVCGGGFGGAHYFDFSEAAIRMPPLRDVALESARLAREAGLQVCYAVNYRPASWAEAPEDIVTVQRQAISAADVAVMNREEAELITGAETVEEALSMLGDLGPRVVAVTAGEEGTVVAHGGGTEFVPARQVEVLYDVGAGDVFHAGLLAGLISGTDPVAATRFGSDAAALWITRPADISGLPTRAEVEALPRL